MISSSSKGHQIDMISVAKGLADAEKEGWRVATFHLLFISFHFVPFISAFPTFPEVVSFTCQYIY